MISRDLRRLSDAIYAVQQATGLEDFCQCCVAGMRMLLDADFYVVNWVVNQKFSGLAAVYPAWPSEASFDALNQHIEEHPLFSRICKNEPDLLDVGQWSEQTTLRAFKRTGLYNEFFRVCGTKYQLGIKYCSPRGAILAPAFNRSSRDYSRKERGLLSMFGRHLRAGFLQVLAQDEVRDQMEIRGFAGDSTASLVVDDAGAIRFASERASDLVRRYFSEELEGSLPRELDQWIRQLPGSPMSFERVHGSGRLLCKCGPQTAWKDSLENRIISGGRSRRWVRLLQFEEESIEQHWSALTELGLTRREAEVLHWMMNGKRNQEISVILGISAATVKKHCENIYCKLGAENRSSATTMGWTALAIR
jgi:DNA-binding CsgD family transcriptional regulator